MPALAAQISFMPTVYSSSDFIQTHTLLHCMQFLPSSIRMCDCSGFLFTMAWYCRSNQPRKLSCFYTWKTLTFLMFVIFGSCLKSRVKDTPTYHKLLKIGAWFLTLVCRPVSCGRAVQHNQYFFHSEMSFCNVKGTGRGAYYKFRLGWTLNTKTCYFFRFSVCVLCDNCKGHQKIWNIQFNMMKTMWRLCETR